MHLQSYIYLVTAMSLIFVISSYIYCHDEENLKGPWILDDKGTVSMNPIVLGSAPFDNVWTKDFWGMHNINDKESHKSWRPLCTISYIWNRKFFQREGVAEEEITFWFHVIDRLLHAFVSALVYPVTGYVLLLLQGTCVDNEGADGTTRNKRSKMLLVALLFSVHPIHVEAVANTTGRAEVLCALFYFIAFLIFARVGVGISLKRCLGVSSSSSSSDVQRIEQNQQKELQIQQSSNQSTLTGSIIGVSLMLLLTLASMLCKEHGVTVPVMCVVWDAFIATNTSIPELWNFILCRRKENVIHKGMDIKAEINSPGDDNNFDECKDEKQGNHKHSVISVPDHNNIHISRRKRRRQQCILFLIRALLCTIGCISLSMWRLSKNGDSKPYFVCEQNPGACEPSRHLRYFYYSYLWSFNFWLMLYPNWLSPDWSGGSIPLMTEFWATDPRFGVVLLTWSVILAVILHSICAAFTRVYSNTTTSFSEIKRRTMLISFYWMLLPFLMSSNLVVYVGFVVADRTLYLPSFGFCLLLTEVLFHLPSFVLSTSSRGKISKVITFTCSLFVLIMYTWKQQVQTKLWSDPVLIWGEAYKLNPTSILSGTEYGMSLVNANRNKDAFHVLEKVHRDELSGNYFTNNINNNDNNNSNRNKDIIADISRTSNLLRTRFKLVTAMTNSGDCISAQPLIEEGLDWIDSIETLLNDIQPSNETNIFSMKNVNLDNKAYFLVSKSRCSENVAVLAATAYDAAVTRPQMEYVLNHANSVSEIIEKVRSSGLDPKQVITSWELENESSQTAKLSFKLRG